MGRRDCRRRLAQQRRHRGRGRAVRRARRPVHCRRGRGRRRRTGRSRTCRFATTGCCCSTPTKCWPPDADAEIARLVTDGPSRVRGYWINRRFFFMGRWLRHSYYPNWNLRLFQHRFGRFERLTSADTESGDVEVHEHVVDQRRDRRGCGPRWITTPSRRSPNFVEKHNRYSNWEAHVTLEAAMGNGHRPQSAPCAAQGVDAPTAVPAAAALPLSLRLAARVPRRPRRLLLRAAARAVRVPERRPRRSSCRKRRNGRS